MEGEPRRGRGERGWAVGSAVGEMNKLQPLAFMSLPQSSGQPQTPRQGQEVGRSGVRGKKAPL